MNNEEILKLAEELTLSAGYKEGSGFNNRGILAFAAAITQEKDAEIARLREESNRLHQVAVNAGFEMRKAQADDAEKDARIAELEQVLNICNDYFLPSRNGFSDNLVFEKINAALAKSKSEQTEAIEEIPAHQTEERLNELRQIARDTKKYSTEQHNLMREALAKKGTT